MRKLADQGQGRHEARLDFCDVADETRKIRRLARRQEKVE